MTPSTTHLQPYREERPWGQFEQFTHNKTSTVKLITVESGERTSLQYHHQRNEFWRVVSGTLVITKGDTDVVAHAGDEFHIPAETPHRIAGGEHGGQLLEISLGEFDEGDIERLEDPYER